MHVCDNFFFKFLMCVSVSSLALFLVLLAEERGMACFHLFIFFCLVLHKSVDVVLGAMLARGHLEHKCDAQQRLLGVAVRYHLGEQKRWK